MKRDLLIIEKDTRDSFSSRLSVEGYSVWLSETGSEALEALSRHNITHAVILNAISMRTNGARTCASLKRAAPGLPVLIVTDKEMPAKADELLEPNISTRKLINRVELYSPIEKKHCLQYGDIFLDEEKQRVFTPKGVSHLSTKEIQILKYLIKKKGALVPKEDLFTRIWKTSYVGDMNTLYTYINFLRGAIEQEPSAPRYLRTVRGKGYLLNGK
ncbi:MAG: response regulator transcription factor [Anaerolineales bacterium]|nr:response regulator transcription factor [Anaerolineales bacterium]